MCIVAYPAGNLWGWRPGWWCWSPCRLAARPVRSPPHAGRYPTWPTGSRRWRDPTRGGLQWNLQPRPLQLPSGFCFPCPIQILMIAFSRAVRMRAASSWETFLTWCWCQWRCRMEKLAMRLAGGSLTVYCPRIWLVKPGEYIFMHQSTRKRKASACVARGFSAGWALNPCAPWLDARCSPTPSAPKSSPNWEGSIRGRGAVYCQHQGKHRGWQAVASAVNRAVRDCFLVD